MECFSYEIRLLECNSTRLHEFGYLRYCRNLKQYSFNETCRNIFIAYSNTRCMGQRAIINSRILKTNLKEFQKPIQLGNFEYIDYKSFYNNALYFGAAIDSLLEKNKDNFFTNEGN